MIVKDFPMTLVVALNRRVTNSCDIAGQRGVLLNVPRQVGEPPQGVAHRNVAAIAATQTHLNLKGIVVHQKFPLRMLEQPLTPKLASFEKWDNIDDDSCIRSVCVTNVGG